MPIVQFSAGIDVSGKIQNTRETQKLNSDLPLRRIVDFAEGAGAKQASKVWYSSKITVNNSGQNLDLSALTDEFGVVQSFTNIKGFAVINRSTEPGKNITVGNAPTDTFLGPLGAAAHTMTIGPDGQALLMNPNAGWAVTGTTDQLRLVGVTGGTEIEMAIWGS
jgi:hypothetical protein